MRTFHYFSIVLGVLLPIAMLPELFLVGVAVPVFPHAFDLLPVVLKLLQVRSLERIFRSSRFEHHILALALVPIKMLS